MASLAVNSTITVEDQVLTGDIDIGSAVTDTIGFYGATKVAQPASASQAAVTLTFATAVATMVLSQTTASSGMWAFGSSTVGQSLRTKLNQALVDLGAMRVLVNQLRAELVTLGLLKGAA